MVGKILFVRHDDATVAGGLEAEWERNDVGAQLNLPTTMVVPRRPQCHHELNRRPSSTPVVDTCHRSMPSLSGRIACHNNTDAAYFCARLYVPWSVCLLAMTVSPAEAGE